MTAGNSAAIATIEHTRAALSVDHVEAIKRMRATSGSERARYKRIYETIKDKLIEASSLEYTIRLRSLAVSPALTALKDIASELSDKTADLNAYAADLRKWRARIKEIGTVLDGLLDIV